MKKISLKIATLLLMLIATASCSDSTLSYAELVENEEGYIDFFLNERGISAIGIDDDVLTDMTNKILNDSIDPATLIKKDQWYEITEGDFKRLYFCIKSFGDRKEGASFYKNKITNNSSVRVRYEDGYLLHGVKLDERYEMNNLGPYDGLTIYNWNPSYYASPYYASYYGSNSKSECTSGGLGFPVRFMWYGGEAELIVPFSLVSSEMSSGYYTMYYGTVRYTKPTYNE